MNIVDDRLRINECFYYFKHLYNDFMKKNENNSKNNDANQMKNALQISNKENDFNGKQDEEIKRFYN